eukprot:4064705-Amphidinium_carterae.1
MEEVTNRLQQLEAAIGPLQQSNAELRNALHQADAELTALRTQAQAQGQAQASTPTGSSKPLVDTRLLSKPQSFSGEQAAWPAWSFVFAAYCEAVSADLGRLMKQAAAAASPVAYSGRDAELSNQLYLMLVLSTTNRALDKVRGAPSGNGLETWRLFHAEWEPRAAQRFTAMLAAIMKTCFHEPLQSSVEAWERDIRVYEDQSGESVPDSIRMAVLVDNMKVGRVKEHLVLNVSRFT